MEYRTGLGNTLEAGTTIKGAAPHIQLSGRSPDAAAAHLIAFGGIGLTVGEITVLYGQAAVRIVFTSVKITYIYCTTLISPVTSKCAVLNSHSNKILICTNRATCATGCKRPAIKSQFFDGQSVPA